MVRGTGKFKQKRGGGRHFSKNMGSDRHVDHDPSRENRDGEEESDDGDGDAEDEDEDESEEEEEGDATTELTRAERKELKKKQAEKEDEEEEDPDLINPNHVQKKLTISDLNNTRELTRREKEQKEKADAKDKYWKLHVQGKTQEAQSDLARLAKIRAERDAAQAKRKAEAEAKAADIETKKQAQLAKRK
ncbi:hypothetical protein M378DRAFT_162035 [Amanita muscaria Koide BX008]|uniref:Casein kinase substrate phosphoprotein PP28 domain-containing protein n=1 Tax=Amanita muscaria (strain Koide BX008) TaxID=946122 RepID=A0A0C2WUG1_AMAMK|nr:hypothetical protein M378DRAFT_162035 [Amanita muscaria Koide BX008]